MSENTKENAEKEKESAHGMEVMMLHADNYVLQWTMPVARCALLYCFIHLVYLNTHWCLYNSGSSIAAQWPREKAKYA